ncbi:MAG TPA: hypothetical protein VK539_01325 [Myxococcaceae bacterium]|nr:hypothetical protein [Myxococcaceae bacterium]
MKNLMTLAAVVFFWGCGGMPEQQDAMNEGAEVPVQQSEQALASNDPFIGSWADGAYVVQVHVQNFGKLTATPNATCWPVGRVIWDYLYLKQVNSDGTRTYWGQALWSECPGWYGGTWHNAEWIVAQNGQTVSMRFQGNTPALYTRQ